MYDSSFPPPVAPPPPLPVQKKHSGVGIASFVIGIVSVLGVCVTFGLSFYAQSASSQTSSSMTSTVGFLGICSMVISLVGVGLGIAGVVQKVQSKVFPIIGLVLSALVLLGMCGIMLLGFSVLSSL